MTQTRYDDIGLTYRQRRTPDPQITAQLARYVDDAGTVLNVGAGAGSYEPSSAGVVALEPSSVMIAQRPTGSAPVVQGVAESLPFTDNSFDVVMGVLTLHHWRDWRAGLAELLRVCRRRIVLLTWTDFTEGFWLSEYLPDLKTMDAVRFPKAHEYGEVLGDLAFEPVPISANCTDGFLCAYWQRPEAYLDPVVRASISSFALLDAATEKRALEELSADLASGRWDERWGYLRMLDSRDYGYRLLIKYVD